MLGCGNIGFNSHGHMYIKKKTFKEIKSENKKVIFNMSTVSQTALDATNAYLFF